MSDPDADLRQLLEAYHHAASDLYLALRRKLGAEECILINPPPQAHIRRRNQLEKAFELNRQVEAKFELLVNHFGGSL